MNDLCTLFETSNNVYGTIQMTMNVHISKTVTKTPGKRSKQRSGRTSRVRLFGELDNQVEELWSAFGGLPKPADAAEIWKGIWLEEAHNSTAIEGNTLVLKQVELLLAEGRAVGGKELREYAEVKSYADAANWVYKQAVDPERWNDGSVLTLTEIRAVHEMAMAAIWEIAPHPDATLREAPGQFRQHEIHRFPGGMQPVSFVEISAELTGWVRSVNSLGSTFKKHKLHKKGSRKRASCPVNLPEELAKLHCRFEQIHPFLDGNGRTGRLLLNLVLVRLGFPPAIIYTKQRMKYLDALRRADDGDVGLLSELIVRAVLDNLYRFIVPAVADSDRLVPLQALATTQVNTGALRTAANRGRLQATRGADGRWKSTRKWVNDYVAQKYSRDA